MKTIRAAVSAALALCAMQSFAEIHTVKFRRLNGTVFHVEQVEHGASAALPSPPAEAHFAFKGWDHGEWLACVTNDFSVYALYENDGSKTWSAGTGFGSKPIAERDEPYSLDEYFRMYDNVAWTDEFSRGSNTAVAINTSYWKYDTEDRGQLSYETSGENQVESNGCLTITIRRESTPRKRFSWATWSNVEYDFTAGGIRSDNKVAFKLGRCEIRAKLSRQRGAWPAFWMMGNSGQWPACGELDILEQPSGGDWISGGLHISPKDNRDRSIQNGATATPEDGVHFGDGFHRFGAIMNEREIVWYVDDHIFKRMDVRDSRYNMVRDRPWLIIIGMGLQTNTWVNAPDAPVDKYDVPELVDHVDYLVDYCRIYTNTNANNTLPYVPSAPGAKLSAPVSAVVWRGWDMNWGRPGAGSYQNNISKGYGERYYTKTALSEYMRREKTDFLAFLTNPTTAMSENLGQFDIPGYTIMSISANANNWNNAENENNGTGRLQLFCSAMFNTDRFSVSDSGVDLMKLSDDANFTNCYAVCGDLVEKATGARVKVVAVNVTTTNGVENAGGTVAQGFDTLFSRLNAIRDERVVVFFQGMSKALYNYIKARADSSLESPYAFAGNYTSTYANQCVYATANVSAAAAHPSVVPVPTKNLRLSYAHNPQALQTTVTFDELPGDGLTDAFVASDYAKSMDVTFSGYSGEALANFPVLVKLSTAIDGFSYSDFQLPDGGDLRFSDSDGNLLPHEIDTWNPNGVSTVWVKVPSLAENAKITAHYGCQSPARVDSSKVWDDDYVGVWHLGEEGLPLRESSRTSSDFTYSSGDSVEFASQGVVGGAVNFKSENRTNAVVAVDHAALDGFQKGTFEAWTKQSERVSNRGILSKSASKAYSYRIYDGSSSAVLYLPLDSEGTNLVWSVAATPVFDVWNHLAYTFDATTESSNVKSYLDGERKSNGSKTIGAHAGNANLCLGTMQGGNAANFVGQIDEVRISKCVRSAAWLKATHDTVANADFATYAVQGAEPPEPDPGPAVYGPLATSQYAKSMNVLFAGAPNNATLTNFPVLVKLSAAIDGFSYADFRRPN
ncbi:MAG: DUF2341 domain-containing protein, partial [Kiritimatiellae bacterium]|nr:DUF2341 domain-containing protein [Kiritimatiellia bacterium]